MRRSRHTPIRKRRIYKKCPFCESKTDITYKDGERLSQFMTERGKITDRGTTGTCSRHQNAITRSIKRARYLGLLPFVVRPR